MSRGNSFPLGWCAPIAPGVRRLFCWFVGPGAFCDLAVISFLAFVAVAVATGSCHRSLLTRLLPTHSFAGYRSRDSRAALPGCVAGRCGRIWWEFLTVRA